MQNVDDFAENMRAEDFFKMQKEKEMRDYDTIAESEVFAIKLEDFAQREGLFNYRMLKLMFIGFKFLQWSSIVWIVIYSPTILYILTGRYFSEVLEIFVYNFKDTGITVFLLSISSMIIGFLGGRYAKLQIQIESNRNIAGRLAKEIRYHLKLLNQ